MTNAAPALLHWFSCPDCLSVVSVGPEGDHWTGTGPACGVCGTRTVYQGRTDTSGAAWQRKEERCACDENCTGARGPKCGCKCGGINHGTGRTVTVTIVEGLPRMSAPRDAAKLLAKLDEFRAERSRVEAMIEARFGDVFRRKRAGEWVSDFSHYLNGMGYRGDFLDACAKRTHAARMSNLARIVRQIEREEVGAT